MVGLPPGDRTIVQRHRRLLLAVPPKDLDLVPTRQKIALLLCREENINFICISFDLKRNLVAAVLTNHIIYYGRKVDSRSGRYEKRGLGA